MVPLSVIGDQWWWWSVVVVIVAPPGTTPPPWSGSQRELGCCTSARRKLSKFYVNMQTSGMLALDNGEVTRGEFTKVKRLEYLRTAKIITFGNGIINLQLAWMIHGGILF